MFLNKLGLFFFYNNRYFLVQCSLDFCAMQVDIPTSSDCLQSLIEASLGLPEFEWEVGWSLASYNNDSQRSRDVFQTQVSLFLKSFLLAVVKNLINLKICTCM